MRDFFDSLDFEPDPFQMDAISALVDGHTVLVTAPTGAGKTVVAEGAIALALSRGRRAFYTTPIKALSNQKFRDLKAIYGEEKVGLLTGDNSVNGDAPIVVMTTEVLRNMIYQQSRGLDDLDVVVLDEVHYLQDPLRGPVWEEVIIHSPQHVQLVCLSATVSNAGDLAEWIGERRGTTDLIVENRRPVPLENLYLIKDLWAEPVLQMMATFGDGSARPNTRVARLLAQQKGRKRRFAAPRRPETVDELARLDMLPAIYFIFSRAGCEAAAATLQAAGVHYNDSEARDIVRMTAERRTSQLSDGDLELLGYGSWVDGLERGVAAHHAGLVPAFKETVEELFAGGYIKVVFATETLALGINMPARSVVLESMSKFTGEGHDLLQAGDYTQLTGRAGRRGIDERGYGVVLYSPYVPFHKVAGIAGAGSHALQSSFRPTYNMVANLVANFTRDQAEELLEASFAQFLRRSQVDRDAQSLKRIHKELARLEQIAECERGDVWDYVKLLGGSKGGQRLDQAALDPGDVLESPGNGRRVIVLQRERWRTPEPQVSVVDEAGKVRRLKIRNLATGTKRVGKVQMPKPTRPRDRRYHRRVARELERFQATKSQVLAWTIPKVDHPVGQCPDVARHIEDVGRIKRLRRQLKKRESDAATQSLLGEFRNTVDLLVQRGHVSGWELSESGEQLRQIYSEMDLLVIESISKGILLGLDVAELAAVASIFVYEPRRGDVGGQLPTDSVLRCWRTIEKQWAAITEAERKGGVSLTRPPDPGFAAIVHAWAGGGALEDILEDDDVAAGDFVRSIRQVLDMLRQIRDAFPSASTELKSAMKALDRGVVAAGGMT